MVTINIYTVTGGLLSGSLTTDNVSPYGNVTLLHDNGKSRQIMWLCDRIAI